MTIYSTTAEEFIVKEERYEGDEGPTTLCWDISAYGSGEFEITVMATPGSSYTITEEQLYYTTLPGTWQALEGNDEDCLEVNENGIVIPFIEGSSSGVEDTREVSSTCGYRLCFTIPEINGTGVITIRNGVWGGSILSSDTMSVSGEYCFTIPAGYSNFTYTVEMIDGTSMTFSNFSMTKECTIDAQVANVLNAQDYYPFGSTMPGRAFNSGDYRYSFNGYEKDDEIKGVGNHLSFGDYGYDPRVVVRWRPDPLTAKYPHISPYAAFGNNPILYIDVDGEEIWIAFEAKKADGTTEIQKVQYKGNKLYTSDGKEYSGGNEYATKVLNDLNQLKLDDPLLKERTETLEKSKHIHTIQMPDPGKHNSNSHSKSKTESHTPTGSTTKYNPDATENVRGDKRTPRAGLAHELLGHGWDADQGKKNHDKTDKGIPMYEVDAVNIENRARAAAGDEKKTSYGGKDIPAKLLDDTHKKTE